MKVLFLTLFPFAFLYGFFAFTEQPGNAGKATFSSESAEESFQVEDLKATVVASNLSIPWEIIWGPDNKIWITEQKGTVSRIDPRTGAKMVLLDLKDIWFFRTAGLLGMALHPDMKNSPYVFLNYTYKNGDKPFSRLVRYTWKSDTLINPKVLLEVAATNGHSGSRLAFSNGKLFWATGDALSNTFAQDINSRNGKILRLNIDGSVPSDNPVKGSFVWAMGFRNIQGMVFSRNGKLYTSEHGDATDDEVNLIAKTKNYGWPEIHGFTDNAKEINFRNSTPTEDPLKAWTPTIAPAGLDYYSSSLIPEWNNSLLMVSLKGKSLRALKLNADGSRIMDEEIFLENQFGRLRDICISPAGEVYISTSNRDWNRTMGDPLPADDRIVKISRSKAGNVMRTAKKLDISADVKSSAELYSQYCASCHQQNGLGLAGVFPPLKGSPIVTKEALPLIRKILFGTADTSSNANVKYDTKMPSFTFLKDNEITAIVNYVRSLQEPKLPPASLQEISQAHAN